LVTPDSWGEHATLLYLQGDRWTATVPDKQGDDDDRGCFF
jgi:hypothetical protein